EFTPAALLSGIAFGTSDETKVPLQEPPPVDVTTNVSAAACEPEVAVPVIVRVYVPAAVEAPTVTVSVELPPAVTEAGLKVAVARAGSPFADKATACAEPAVTAVVTLALALCPWAIESVVGLTETEKSFAAPVFHTSVIDGADAALAIAERPY